MRQTNECLDDLRINALLGHQTKLLLANWSSNLTFSSPLILFTTVTSCTLILCTRFFVRVAPKHNLLS